MKLYLKTRLFTSIGICHKPVQIFQDYPLFRVSSAEGEKSNAIDNFPNVKTVLKSITIALTHQLYEKLAQNLPKNARAVTQGFTALARLTDRSLKWGCPSAMWISSSRVKTHLAKRRDSLRRMRLKRTLRIPRKLFRPSTVYGEAFRLLILTRWWILVHSS